MASLGTFNGSAHLDAAYTLTYDDEAEVIVENKQLPWMDEFGMITLEPDVYILVGQYTLEL